MKLLAIDGNSILNRSFYGVHGLTTATGIPTGAVYGFYHIFDKMVREVSPDAIVAAFDVKEPTFRHKEYPNYKANRHKMPDDLAIQLPYTKEMLTYLGCTILEAPGYEADDILGTLARLATESGNECVIATGDRDSLQLVNDRVTVRLATNKEAVLYDVAKIKESYGVSPKELIEVKALMGDSSDNIPGVKGIGEKSALSLISQYHTIDAVFSQLDDLKTTTRIRNLLHADDAKALAFLSRKLGTINCDVPIENDLTQYQKKPTDHDRLLQLFQKLEFRKLVEKLTPKEQMTPAANEPEVPPPIKIENPPIEKAKQLLAPCKTIDFIFWEDSLILAADHRQLIRYTSDIPEAFGELISKSDQPKRTANAKEAFRYCLDQNLPLENLRFSADLAGYLINCLERDHSLPALKQRYLPNAALPACFPQLFDQLEVQLEQLSLTKLNREIELPLALVLSDMERLGVQIDADGLTAFGDELQTAITAITSEIYQIIGETFNLNSPKELGHILFETLSLPHGKKTKLGYSTNAEILEKIIDYHPVVPKILEYRMLTKLYSTYVVGLLKLRTSDGRIHTLFKQTETRTGRISSADPNLQNIPIRNQLGSHLRRFFTARDGYRLIDADYSQIELRLLAHIADDQRLIAAFQNGEDIHTATASEVFGLPIDRVPSELRRRAKTINFGIVYGMSAYSLGQDLGVSVGEARNYIERYNRTYSGVRDYMEQTVKESRETGQVRTLFGRLRPLPEIRSTSARLCAFGERVARNTPIQGAAADIIKIAMIRIYHRLKEEQLDAHLLLQVHDELLVEAAVSDIPAARKVVQEEMEHAVQLKVPLAVDLSEGDSWYDAKG